MHACGINMRYLGVVRYQLFLGASERLRNDQHHWVKRKGRLFPCTYRVMLYTEVSDTCVLFVNSYDWLIFYTRWQQELPR